MDRYVFFDPSRVPPGLHAVGVPRPSAGRGKFKSRAVQFRYDHSATLIVDAARAIEAVAHDREGCICGALEHRFEQA